MKIAPNCESRASAHLVESGLPDTKLGSRHGGEPRKGRKKLRPCRLLRPCRGYGFIAVGRGPRVGSCEIIPVPRPSLPGPPAPHELPAVKWPAPLAPPFLRCVSDAIPFRTYTVAESAGIHGNKGEQPLRPPLPDCACETPFHESECGDRWIGKGT